MSVGAVKGLGALIVFSGLSYGGREVYLIVQSGNWEDELKRQGIRLPDPKDTKFYDGVLKDQDAYIKSHSQLKDKNSGDALKGWCEGELKKNFNRWEGNNNATLKLLQQVCSVSGITKIKGWLIAKSSEELKFIQDESNPDEEYKRVFALYRYEDEEGNSQLLDWLNEGVQEKQKLKKTDNIETGYKKLKEKCEQKLSMKHQNKVDTLSQDELQNLFKWCKKLKDSTNNDTIKNRLKQVAKRRDLDDDEKNGLKDKWEHTPQVVAEIKKAIGKEKETNYTLTNEDYLNNFCKDEAGNPLHEKLTTEDKYQFRYIVLGSVCYKNQS